ncbi:MAG: T9SS type A sorting domain-containing protein [Candidatus Kapaibacterium sp.]
MFNSTAFRSVFLVLCLIVLPFFAASAQGNCDAATVDEFFACYGGKSAFSEHAIRAVTTFIEAEDAIKVGNYTKAKTLLDDLYKKYPIGDNIWWNAWNAPNGANIGSPNGYYGMRMMEDIIDYGLHPNPTAKAKKVNMNVVIVGCSQGIQPRTKAELQSGTGVLVTHSIDPLIKDNNYRRVWQSLDLFRRYITAITNGMLEVEVGVIELDTLCLPVKVNTTKPYFAYETIQPVWGALSQAAKDTTDWFLITYPSHVPEGPDFDDESFITGGMGSDAKGGPVFIADDKWVVRKPAHLGKGMYTDIERRMYLPQWLQHEFFHHLYRIYPELKLEVKGHDWFDRKFWPSDFVGQFETDYYSETLHKKIQPDCSPLARKLITRVSSGPNPAFTQLAIDELLGEYSLDVIQNDWHVGNIISDNGKYFWKNKANVQWSVTPNFANGKLSTGADSPYPGQDFFLQLYQTVEGDAYPGVTSLKFGGEFYKKRFGLMRGTLPIEIALGNYTRVPVKNTQHTGSLIKTLGQIQWKSDAGDAWLLTPSIEKESLIMANSTPTPNAPFQLILVDAACGSYNLGFKYSNYYYWKPKRSPADESPLVSNSIKDLELSKDFGSYTIKLSDVFKDPKGDSLLFYVTSEDASFLKAKIESQQLVLAGGSVGTTTVHVMAIDFNGGLAVDEFNVVVKSSSSAEDESTSEHLLTVSPLLTSDVVVVRGATAEYTVEIISLLGAYRSTVLLSGSTNTIDVRSLASGVYILKFSNSTTGHQQLCKLIKY